MPNIVCISDTHARHDSGTLRVDQIPHGDILVCAGDVTMGHNSNKFQYQTLRQLISFNEWIGKLPHPIKIVIAGNHDHIFEHSRVLAKETLTNAVYLQDESYSAYGLKFYGSPWTPRFFDWAFNADRGAAIKRYWDNIDDDTDVLITHGPPKGIMDLVGAVDAFGQLIKGQKMNCGCEDLKNRIAELKKLKLHIFGHVHVGYGYQVVDNVKYVNASNVNSKYLPVNHSISVNV